MELEDTLTIKKTLNRFGYYKIPSYGLTPYPDKAMFDGLKAYRVSKDDPGPAEIWPGDGFLHHFNTDLRALDAAERVAGPPRAGRPAHGSRAEPRRRSQPPCRREPRSCRRPRSGRPRCSASARPG